jgi:nucleoside phosphorylase
VVTRRAGEPPPGRRAGRRAAALPQMPAYHLVRADHSGITMVNIGVGPANAKTITDHIAVLRPHAWLMLGHCAGLRNTQQLGDYVLAHGYVREDHVLDEELPLWVPIPALAEVQVALERRWPTSPAHRLRAQAHHAHRHRGQHRQPQLGAAAARPGPERRFSQSRAVALDMESATIAANGFRFRVPYGTLLCVSDKPLHGEIKLPGMANHFYRERVDQHLRIGMRAIELLRQPAPGTSCTAASCAALPRWPGWPGSAAPAPSSHTAPTCGRSSRTPRRARGGRSTGWPGRAGARRHRAGGPVRRLGNGQHHQQPGGHRSRRHAAEDPGQGQPWAPSARSACGLAVPSTSAPTSSPSAGAQALRKPLRGDLHAHRVDAGQAEAGGRTRQPHSALNDCATGSAAASVQPALASAHSQEHPARRKRSATASSANSQGAER